MGQSYSLGQAPQSAALQGVISRPEYRRIRRSYRLKFSRDNPVKLLEAERQAHARLRPAHSKGRHDRMLADNYNDGRGVVEPSQMALLTSKNQAGRNWNTTSKSKVIESPGKSQETSDKHTSSTWDWSAEWEAPAEEESFKLNAPYDPTPITKLNLIDQYLEDNGFFDIKPGQPEEYLDLNDIHPIFRFDNFDTTLLEKYRAKKAWKAMRPALALATRFLTSPDAKRDFWHLLFFGELKTDEATGKRYFVHSTKEDDTSTTSGDFENSLLEMSECINFFWTPLNARHNGTRYNGIFYPDLGSALGMVDRSVLDVIAERDNDATQDYLHSWHGQIGLSSVYLYHLLSLKSPARPGNWNSANMRLQLSLATLICHELSHAIWSKRGIEGPEPYVFLTDQKPEIGFSFEFFLAGVVVELSLVCSVIGRMESLTWDNTFAMPDIRAVVDMKWVESWFRKDTWTGKVTFGTAPSTTGNRRPRLWIADRWFKNHILAPAIFQPVLYIDGKAVVSTCTSETSKPLEGVALHEWFPAVSGREIGPARGTSGSKEDSLFPSSDY